MIELPDPGEGRSWYLSPDGELQLWQGKYDGITDMYSPTNYLINADYVNIGDTYSLRLKARRLVALADAAGTYTYENGKQVKK